MTRAYCVQHVKAQIPQKRPQRLSLPVLLGWLISATSQVQQEQRLKANKARQHVPQGADHIPPRFSTNARATSVFRDLTNLMHSARSLRA